MSLEFDRQHMKQCGDVEALCDSEITEQCGMEWVHRNDAWFDCEMESNGWTVKRAPSFRAYLNRGCYQVSGKMGCVFMDT